MRRRAAIVVALLLVFATASAACGESETSEGVEGEPVDVGGLSYNVQITRFLNPDDAEDSEYLAGQPPPEPGKSYLGVFLVIENDSDEPIASASGYTIIDTLDTEYDAVDSDSPYALDIGAEVPADGVMPLPNTTASTGPNHGSLLIFPVSDDVSDNRPLHLEIQSSDGTGDVILDI